MLRNSCGCLGALTRALGFKPADLKTLTTYELYIAHKDYYGAGLHFIDEAEGTIVAGAQPHKKTPCISGFGGKAEPGDGSCVVTAYRETIEELCGVSVGENFIRALVNDLGLVPLGYKMVDGYVYYLLSQRDMVSIIGYVWMRHRSFMRYYVGPYAPQSVEEVVRCRVWSSEEAEVEQLYVLYLTGTGTGPGQDALPLDPLFIKDMGLIHAWWVRKN